MLIILDRETKKIKENMGTNSLFPRGDIPIEEKESEIYIRIPDDSSIAKKILGAYDYEIILSDENVVIDVVVHKTLEEYQAEQPIEPQEQSTFDELSNYVLDVDFRVVMIEMGV